MIHVISSIRLLFFKLVNDWYIYLKTILTFIRWNKTDHTWWITEALKPLIVNLEFYRKKRLVYKAVSYAGYVGVITAMKPVTILVLL